MLNETIAAGLNNPDCAFYVGAFYGNTTTFKYFAIGIMLYFVFKLIDTLAFEPLMKWIKTRLKWKKKR